jgi:hypothetical protein
MPGPTLTARPETVASHLGAERLAGTRPLTHGHVLINGFEKPPVVALLLEMNQAEAAIKAKAASLGGLAGSPAGSLEGAGNGWMQHYAGCDIYVSEHTGAHEVHGDIRAKYNALNGPTGVLGLPVTDETTTPDQVGRFNHFEGGSIYWTPHTGPMMVRGSVRDHWAAGGWERGHLGYPVCDEQRIVGLHPSDHPNIAWSLFENGAVVSTPDGAADALVAYISPAQLRTVLRKRIDAEVHKSPDNIGLQPEVETLAVSGWSYDFWASLPRMVTLRLHGFHDNGLLSDTDFELSLRLRFSLAWPTGSFTQPAQKSLIAALDWISVTAHGIASGDVAQGVHDGVRRAFFRGGSDPAHPEVPNGAVFITSIPTGINQTGAGNIDVIDVLTTAEGGLAVLVNPLPGPVGGLRRLIAQNTIDAFLENP